MDIHSLVSALIYWGRCPRRTVFNGIKKSQVLMVFHSKVFVVSLIDSVGK